MSDTPPSGNGSGPDVLKHDKSQIVIVDLEGTCWGPNDPAAGVSEIIEIGAVKVSAATLEAVDEFASLVRPVRYPMLSPFCIELIGLTQAEIDTARPYPEVWEPFLNWCAGPHITTIACWGANDVPMMKRDCAYHRLAYPFGDDFINLKQAFASVHEGKKFGMKGALRLMGIPLEGSHHRALPDARNIHKLFRAIRDATSAPTGP